jgi:hypothetical protein
MPSTPPTSSPSSQPPDDQSRTRVTGLVTSPWNLLLLVPLLMLVTPWFNHTDPKLAGLPFFYWFQFLFVIVGVGCVWIVYLATRRKPVVTVSADELSIDDLDEGNLR